MITPKRMIVDRSGYSVPAYETGIRPDIVFIRDDGWSLGAASDLESHAYSIWKDCWSHFVRRGDVHPRPIQQYKPKEA